MKIAFLLSYWGCGGRPLNFFADNINISTRSLTGTDLAFTETAKNFVKLNHDVFLFTSHVAGTKPEIWNGVKLFDIDQCYQIIDNSFDVIISYNEPDILRGLPTKPLKIVVQMLNDFTYCQPNFDDLVDLWISPCEMHCDWLIKLTPKPEKWKICPLGAESYWYQKIEKNPYSVAWISSPDRGSHLLLECWPEIKSNVPEATLRMFYHLNESNLEKIEPNDTHIHPNSRELAQRIRYIKYATSKLKHLNVERIGSISRKQMAKELSKTCVLVGPLSTVAPTEGWACSVTEGMTAGCFTLMGDIDCLGSIYGSVAPMIQAPVENNKEQLINTIVKALTDEKYHQETTIKCKEFISKYTWTNSAKILEKIINEKNNY